MQVQIMFYLQMKIFITILNIFLLHYIYNDEIFEI